LSVFFFWLATEKRLKSKEVEDRERKIDPTGFFFFWQGRRILYFESHEVFLLLPSLSILYFGKY
jgi:hypothetical protein